MAYKKLILILLYPGLCTAMRSVCVAKLFTATERGDVEKMKKFLRGMRPTVFNSAGQTPLHIAVRIKSLEAAQILLEANADPNLADNNKRTPLQEAVSHEKEGMVRLLIAHGADLMVIDKKWCQNLLHWAVRYKNPYAIDELLSSVPPIYPLKVWRFCTVVWCCLQRLGVIEDKNIQKDLCFYCAIAHFQQLQIDKAKKLCESEDNEHRTPIRLAKNPYRSKKNDTYRHLVPLLDPERPEIRALIAAAVAPQVYNAIYCP